jgi:hypothetical protein
MKAYREEFIGGGLLMSAILPGGLNNSCDYEVELTV